MDRLEMDNILLKLLCKYASMGWTIAIYHMLCEDSGTFCMHNMHAKCERTI